LPQILNAGRLKQALRPGIYYLENGFTAFIKLLLVADVFETMSSFWLSAPTFTKVSNIIIKTGTNSNRNGDVFANVFIGLLFIYFSKADRVFGSQELMTLGLMKQIE
jgi:hypothetical protein